MRHGSRKRVVTMVGAAALVAMACADDPGSTTPGSSTPTAVTTSPSGPVTSAMVTPTTEAAAAPGSTIVIDVPPTTSEPIVVAPPLPTVQYADQFDTDGDPINDWFWLRDAGGAQAPRWVFGAMPGGGQIVLDFDILATDQFNGGPGFPARFWLTYGAAGNQIGPSAEAPISVELQNAALVDDPTGYTTRGTVNFTYDLLPPNTTDLWVAITRSAPDGTVEPYHIAVRSASTVLRLEDSTGTTTDGTGATDDTTDGTTDGTTDDNTTGDGTADDGTEHEGFDGPPLIVALGDSYISGEAGRWAGNPDVLIEYPFADALGSSAYNDARFSSSEVIPGCHRSHSALIRIGQAEDGTAVDSLNLACSGGQTYSTSDKPGVDRCPDDGIPTDTNVADPTYWNKFRSNTSPTTPEYTYTCPGDPVRGQVDRLAVFAAERDVKMVVLSIGGNNFGFSSVVTQCVMDFLQPRMLGTKRVWIGVNGYGYWQDVPTLIEDHCLDDQIAGDTFSDANILARRAEITASIMDIRRVMSENGHTDADWTLVVLTYPSPIPNGGGFAFMETGWNRFDEGCGFWDEDADWANSVALPTINQTVRAAALNVGAPNIVIMDTSHAFDGRRLCEDGTEKVGSVFGPTTWQSDDAVDESEWVQEIHGILSEGGKVDVPPFQQQESFHPNYWGQMALRNCVRQVYNNGAPVGGKCLRDGNGLNSFGEPNMRLDPL